MNSTSLVLAGSWNQAIFTPPWVRTHFFDGRNLTVEASVGPDFILTFRQDTAPFQLTVERSKVQVRPTDVSSDAMTAAEASTIQVLELLSVTPITGVGINFGFRGEERDRGALETLLAHELPHLDQLGYSQSSFSLTRTLMEATNQQDSPDRLNFTLVGDATKCSALFNYHFPVENAEEAVGKLRGQVVPRYNAARRFVELACGIECDSKP